MSELKAFVTREGFEAYLKSEADKVIAELKDDCAYWKMSEGNAVNAMHETEEYAMQLYKELRHQKFKRCLVTAKWCLTEKVYFHYRYDDWGDKGYDRSYKWKKVVFWSKWARRWLELAEKFSDKEAK